ncbi:hypothetical protein B0I35DRAFT_407606 [Stachybotrys elegans]|uniref:Uncharacterized protein n=1 Tax=Stachybotrys elegans TaxID=80388 RepID=A0A8K0WTE8_9HYPO|nr:hypothetical protein B0I35DRAFT_407606 [Stachybotrys elegans]
MLLSHFFLALLAPVALGLPSPEPPSSRAVGTASEAAHNVTTELVASSDSHEEGDMEFRDPGQVNPDGTPRMCSPTPMDSCNFGMQFCRVWIETYFHLYDGACKKLVQWDTKVPWNPQYKSLTSPLPFTIELSNMGYNGWGAITGDMWYAGRYTKLGPDSSYCWTCGYMNSCTCCQKAFLCR